MFEKIKCVPIALKRCQLDQFYLSIRLEYSNSCQYGCRCIKRNLGRLPLAENLDTEHTRKWAFFAHQNTSLWRSYTGANRRKRTWSR